MNMRKRQLGQTMVEHLILWPLIFFISMFSIQLGFFYRDKAVVNSAAMRAAQEGAVRHASVDEMNKKFVEALTPLYLRRQPNAVNYAAALLRAYRDNLVSPTSGRAGRLSGILIERVTPNQSVFNQFASNQYTLPTGCEDNPRSSRRNWPRSRCREARRPTRQIPNDNLNVRSSATRRVNVDGQAVDMNLQDANLLKIRAHYCARMDIPLAAPLLYYITRTFTRVRDRNWYTYFSSSREARQHPAYRRCLQKTAANLALYRNGRATRKYYIPVSADAVVRMQSAARL